MLGSSTPPSLAHMLFALGNMSVSESVSHVYCPVELATCGTTVWQVTRIPCGHTHVCLQHCVRKKRWQKSTLQRNQAAILAHMSFLALRPSSAGGNET